MRKPTTREIVYLVILGIVLVGWMFIGENSRLGGGRATEVTLTEIGEAPVVDIARLNMDPPSYSDGGRNLFKYGSPPRVGQPPPPPPPREPTPTPTPRARPTTTTPPPSQPAAPSGPRPPQPSFKYLGHLGPKGDQIAVFEAGENMLLARTGDTVEGQFKVMDFKYEVVVLGYTDERFSDQTTELTIRR